MKILMVTEFFSSLDSPVFSGGVESRTFAIAKRLGKNHQVAIISRRRKGETKFETKGNLRVWRLGREVDNSTATIFSLFDRLHFVGLSLKRGSKIEADLVEGSNFVAFLPAFFLGVYKKIPKVVWYPDVLIGTWQDFFGKFLGFLGEFGEKIFLKLPWNYFIAISHPVFEKLVRQGVDEKKIIVIACGVEQKLFSQEPVKFPEPTLCVISRFLAYKKIENVIEALKILEKEFPKIKLIIIGEGTRSKEVKQLVAKLGLKHRIKFYRRVKEDKLFKLLGGSHLLIHPSVIEGFGIVLVEAAALGTPFVAVNIPTSTALAKELQSGIIVARNRVEKLASGIRELLVNKKLYRKLQQAGRKNARKFNWDKLSRETEKIYEKIIQ